MTVKEASKTVEGYLPDCDTRKFVLDILARAEKKIPYSLNNVPYACFCPSCNEQCGWNGQEKEHPDYCSHCGQALDWSDVE